MSGQAISAPELLPWVDIEDIKRYPTVFTDNESIVVHEKLHGSACLTTVLMNTETTLVTSKGLGEKRLSLVQDEKNLYWKAVLGWRVPEAALAIGTLLNADRVGIFGEVYGKGVQDLAYGSNARNPEEPPGYAVFDISVDVAGKTRWLDQDELVALIVKLPVTLPLVPHLYSGPYHEQTVFDLANGVEQVSGHGTHIREGVIIRPAKERYSPVLGGRAILKSISPAYLTRQGGTEFQ